MKNKTLPFKRKNIGEIEKLNNNQNNGWDEFLSTILAYGLTFSGVGDYKFYTDIKMLEEGYSEENGYFFRVQVHYAEIGRFAIKRFKLDALITINGNRMCLFTDDKTEIYQIKDQMLYNFLLLYDEYNNKYTYLEGRQASVIGEFSSDKEEINTLKTIISCQRDYKTIHNPDVEKYEKSLMTI